MEEEFSERVQFDLNGKRTKLIDDKSLLEVYPPSAAMASLSDLLKMYSSSSTALLLSLISNFILSLSALLL